jgi:hypothetical protein
MLARGNPYQVVVAMLVNAMFPFFRQSASFWSAFSELGAVGIMA